MTVEEYLALWKYDHAGNVLLGMDDITKIADAYELLSEEDKVKVTLALEEE